MRSIVQRKKLKLTHGCLVLEGLSSHLSQNTLEQFDGISLGPEQVAVSACPFGIVFEDSTIAYATAGAQDLYHGQATLGLASLPGWPTVSVAG